MSEERWYDADIVVPKDDGVYEVKMHTTFFSLTAQVHFIKNRGGWQVLHCYPILKWRPIEEKKHVMDSVIASTGGDTGCNANIIGSFLKKMFPNELV